jgi:hypothetical protein
MIIRYKPRSNGIAEIVIICCPDVLRVKSMPKRKNCFDGKKKFNFFWSYGFVSISRAQKEKIWIKR